ncbi:SRPBCC family protein [Paracidobacterium acidisoli]|uniref:Polyketide cyclase n=1 Tax=Paracidobacterium acidisoli TaxID=2303751 RepID=A0A372IQ83_9BACT|nr:SRPBCC family protein [Paracidobacterium acidisoli]MBT9331235.1 SRPBCC family protein [Paracidobacterium acidisoli]
MQERSVAHSTFTIERSYPAAPGRVFAALADPAKKRRWFVENEASVFEEFTMDFRVGGQERIRSRIGSGPYVGVPCTNDTTYLDIVLDRRIVLAYSMTLGEQRISSSLATFELLAAEAGTVLLFTEQAAFFEGADGPAMREEGWRLLLDHLAKELS